MCGRVESGFAAVKKTSRPVVGQSKEVAVGTSEMFLLFWWSVCSAAGRQMVDFRMCFSSTLLAARVPRACRKMLGGDRAAGLSATVSVALRKSVSMTKVELVTSDVSRSVHIWRLKFLCLFPCIFSSNGSYTPLHRLVVEFNDISASYVLTRLVSS